MIFKVTDQREKPLWLIYRKWKHFGCLTTALATSVKLVGENMYLYQQHNTYDKEFAKVNECIIFISMLMASDRQGMTEWKIISIS